MFGKITNSTGIDFAVHCCGATWARSNSTRLVGHLSAACPIGPDEAEKGKPTGRHDVELWQLDRKIATFTHKQKGRASLP